MKQFAPLFVILSLLAGTQAAFGQQIELCEPMLDESVLSQGAVFVYIPAADVIDLPEYEDLAYLWAFNPGDAAEPLEFLSVASLAAAASSDAATGIIPRHIRNNEYFLESVRLRDMAQQAFDYGDYDASANYAAEALRYAQLSDEYVALQLKIRDADNAIARARDRMAWAASRGIDKSYPARYGEAQTSYDEAVTARGNEDWDGAIAAAQRVLYVLADATEVLPLPAQYTVRTWATERDCLWNIAGYSWVYGDSFQWKRLYEANKAKMPEANNPDLIHPGTILDIPSIRGETRQGMWQAGRSYSPLPKAR
ncbi:LysM peptidoglycan-binding domain-containing protein [Breznakiella homolactica]|uniref:LysM domain-containing protein n=1 Tax=Breznakiella homolactica TaxID=2798577 RepID=A0A7T7XQK7_9SPIR|nr:hypothetical protein [Breznakiella homolactica]QQO10676.1 hypothetical protein JFL75_07095 [Breznakiella homolactica]